MKKYLFIILALSVSCILTAQILPSDTARINQVVLDSSRGTEMLVGYCSREGLKGLSEFGSQFQGEYDGYQPNIERLFLWKDSLENITINIILGTWCSDSQREVPRFFKLTDLIGIEQDKMIIVGVDRKKSANVIGLKELKIDFVPTIIFFRNGKEIGRIIETPNETLEDDLFKILSD